MAGETADFTSARRWELAAGPGIVDGIRSSGAASRMLTDVCAAVRRTVEFAISTGFVQPREILVNYPLVLDRCDSLAFDERPQALAYLSLHLPDRYCRVFQVLEELLVRGMLPLGRGANFAAVDIGAGPGPGIFAIRNFYAALSQAARHTSATSVATLGTTAIVERSCGMSSVMHHFAEQLIQLEQGPHPRQPDTEPLHVPHPYTTELAASATPFGASYEDFENLDLRGEHNRARHQLAHQLEDALDISLPSTRQLAYEEPIRVPSGYAIALMTNFLTTTEAVPRVSDAIRLLMKGALVPGGIVLVLGGVGQQYPEIYEHLDRIAIDSGLHVMSGFDEPRQAGNRPEELEILRTMTHQIWAELATRADNAVDVKCELRDLDAGAIFDESLPYWLPKFRVRAYRRGRWPTDSATRITSIDRPTDRATRPEAVNKERHPRRSR